MGDDDPLQVGAVRMQVQRRPGDETREVLRGGGAETPRSIGVDAVGA
jgi:hypothetical protein